MSRTTSEAEARMTRIRRVGLLGTGTSAIVTNLSVDICRLHENDLSQDRACCY